MAQTRTTILARFGVSPETLFDIVSDHERLARYIPAAVEIVRGPKRGVGTVRRIRRGPLAIDEEVVAFDPPRRFVYRIVRGAPMFDFHSGEVRVEPWGESGSQLLWDVVFASRIPGVVEAITPLFRRGLNEAIKKLSAELA